MMICRNPYISAGRAFGCGQCIPCRINKRREWAHRMLLEAKQYSDNSFVTLTYDDANLPVGGSLVPRDTQLWLKRLRKAYAPRKFRFFLCGEYGNDTERPHYHVALFNYPRCIYGVSRYSKFRASCCSVCDAIRETWGKGHIYCGSLEDASANYIAQYVTKKMTHKDDVRLKGRHPEFARMSLRPGIGGDAVWEVADVLMMYNLIPENPDEDIPTALRHGKKVRPLGRYLSRRLRKVTGREEAAPKSVTDKQDAEMLPLRVAAKADNENPSLKARVVASNMGAIERVEGRARIFKSRRRI